MGTSRNVKLNIWSDAIVYGIFGGLGEGDVVMGYLYQAEKVRFTRYLALLFFLVRSSFFLSLSCRCVSPLPPVRPGRTLRR
jgi:hypothetical protein